MVLSGEIILGPGWDNSGNRSMLYCDLCSSGQKYAFPTKLLDFYKNIFFKAEPGF